MKFTVHKLRLGDLLRAQIVEVIGNDELIVSFHGDLIRVQNKSLSHLRPGDKILVRVTQTAPLFFQLVSESDEKRGATRINLEV